MTATNDVTAPRVGNGATHSFRTSPAITLGYYAHFMPEVGSKGRGAIDGLLGERRGSAWWPKLPRFSLALLSRDLCLYASEKSSADCKVEEMGGLGKCCERS